MLTHYAVCSELNSSVGDHYLLRALLRSAILKSLSTLLSRLNALVDHSTSVPPTPPLVQPTGSVAIPAKVSLDLAISRAALEVRRGIDRALREQGMPSFVRETLSPWSEKLNSLVGHLVAPVTASIRSSGAQIISGARLLEEPVRQTASAEPKPKYLTDLAALLSSTKSLFFTRLDAAPGGESEHWLVSIATHVLWKGLLAFGARPVGVRGRAPERRATPPAGNTTSPPMSPKRTAGLRLVTRHRSTSPTNDDSKKSKLVRHVEAFKDVMVKFTDGICKPQPDRDSNPKPECEHGCHLCGSKGLFRAIESDDDDEALPSEALCEALDALDAFLLVSKAAERSDGPELIGCALDAMTSGATKQEGEKAMAGCRALVRALATVPLLILVHLVASRAGVESGLRLPHETWGTTWEEYDRALSGFAAAEEWSEEVGWEMERECNRVLAEEPSRQSATSSDWIRILRRVVEARVDD
jgi:hypothetical protein